VGVVGGWVGKVSKTKNKQKLGTKQGKNQVPKKIKIKGKKIGNGTGGK